MRPLFVENHRVFADTVIQAFFPNDHVTVVASPRAVWDLALDAFDAALVDYDLDDGKGDEVVRALEQRRPNLPVIAVSAHEGGNAMLTAAGADAVCAKIELARIREVLARVCAPRP